MTAKKPARKNTAAAESPSSNSPAVPQAQSNDVVDWKLMSARVNELADRIYRTRNTKAAPELLRQSRESAVKAYNLLMVDTTRPGYGSGKVTSPNIRKDLSPDETNKRDSLLAFFKLIGQIHQGVATDPKEITERLRDIASGYQAKGPAADAPDWLTVSEVAKMLAEGEPGIRLESARGIVSRNCQPGPIRTNGKVRRARRLDAESARSWLLQRRDRANALDERHN